VWRFEDATGWQQLNGDTARLGTLSIADGGIVVAELVHFVNHHGDYIPSGLSLYQDGPGWTSIWGPEATHLGAATS
jgi:hypothetical protein